MQREPIEGRFYAWELRARRRLADFVKERSALRLRKLSASPETLYATKSLI